MLVPHIYVCLVQFYAMSRCAPVRNCTCSYAHEAQCGPLGRGLAKGGGRLPPPQSFEKPFFQNVEIRVENCWGGLSDGERRPVLEFVAKLSDYSHFPSKANKELLKKSFLFSINLMDS